jgi:hypothetical protein
VSVGPIGILFLALFVWPFYICWWMVVGLWWFLKWSVLVIAWMAGMATKGAETYERRKRAKTAARSPTPRPPVTAPLTPPVAGSWSPSPAGPEWQQAEVPPKPLSAAVADPHADSPRSAHMHPGCMIHHRTEDAAARCKIGRTHQPSRPNDSNEERVRAAEARAQRAEQDAAEARAALRALQSPDEVVARQAAIDVERAKRLEE